MSIYNPVSLSMYENLQLELPNLVGGIQFGLGGISFNIQSKDGIGGMIQEWVGVWAKHRGYNIVEQSESQEFPDFFIGQEKGLLEIKTYNAAASPSFDIANFQSYCESLTQNPERLDADYLIFAYRLNNGALCIENVFLKKIWEISSASERWPIKTQTKRDVIYNLRPCAFHSARITSYPPFKNKEEFVDALYKTESLYLNQKETQNLINYRLNLRSQ